MAALHPLHAYHIPSQSQICPTLPPWATSTEIVGITLQLQPVHDSCLYPQYTIGLHAWLLDQVRQSNPDLSAYLHDGESEKPFTISALQGMKTAPGCTLQLKSQETYSWTITALSQPVVTWLTTWLTTPPTEIDLRNAPLRILDWGLPTAVSPHPPTTYPQLFEAPYTDTSTLALSFFSPTSDRLSVRYADANSTLR